MKLLKKTGLLLLMLLATSAIEAQISVKGQVLSTTGNEVEYATVKVDSQYTITDAHGRFELEVPQGHQSDLIVSHISYHDQHFPFAQYQQGHLTAQLQEKVVSLPDMAIVQKKAKQAVIANKGMRGPGVIEFVCRSAKNAKEKTLVSTDSYQIEDGPIINNDHDYLLKNIRFSTKECTLKNPTLRIIIYEMGSGNTFTPILHKPIYVKVGGNQEYNIGMTESVILKKGKRYYAGVSVVGSEGAGKLRFPTYFHKGAFRRLSTNRFKQMPVSIGLKLEGKMI